MLKFKVDENLPQEVVTLLAMPATIPAQSRTSSWAGPRTSELLSPASAKDGR